MLLDKIELDDYLKIEAIVGKYEKRIEKHDKNIKVLRSEIKEIDKEISKLNKKIADCDIEMERSAKRLKQLQKKRIKLPIVINNEKSPFKYLAHYSIGVETMPKEKKVKEPEVILYDEKKNNIFWNENVTIKKETLVPEDE